MAKNMTRKGLALGSTVALAAGMIAALPASAAITGTSRVTLVPGAGTSYSVLAGAGQTFDLSSTVASSIAGSATDGLKWHIADGDEILTDGGATRDTDGSWIENAAGLADQTLTLTLAAALDESASVDVTAWFDDNGNDEIDSDEYAQTRTVNFLVDEDVTPAATYDAPIIGDTTFAVVVTTTPVLNTNYLADGDVVAEITWQGDATAYSYDAARGTTAGAYDGTWDVTADASDFTPTEVTKGTYSITPYVGTNKGTKVSFGVTEAVADEAYGEVASSADIKVSGNETDTVAATVREKVKTVVATITVVDEDEDPVGAGKPVRVTPTVTGATGVKLNTKTVTSGTAMDFVTDANGQVVLTVASSGVDTDVVALSAVAEGVAGTTTTVTFTWAAATQSMYDLNDASGSAYRSIASGGSYTFDFVLVDQWGQQLAGDYQLNVAVSGNTVSENNVSIASGRTSVTVADAKLGTGNVTVVVTPQKKVSGTWGTTGVPAAQTFTLVPAAQTGAAVVINAIADASEPVSTATLVDGDERVSQVDATGSGTFTVAGSVVDAVSLAAKKGAAVTISGDSSILFIAGNKAAYGSLTISADDSGAYSFAAVSNKSQKDSVVTVSSLDATKTVKLTWEPALATSGKNLAMDAPATVSPGSTLLVTVTLTDKFGNPVKNNDGTNVETDHAVNVDYDGPGLLISTIPTMTDANGEITFRVLLGSGDLGTATVTATFEGGTSATTDDVSVQASVVIGVVGNAGAYSSWTKKLDASSAKIYAKNVVGEGKVQFFLNGEEIAWVRAVDATDPKLRTANGSAYLVRTVEFVEGQKNVLEVYLDGVRTTRTAYTY